MNNPFKNIKNESGQAVDPNKAHIYNLIIVDESGSMGGLVGVTVGGINETIGTIRKAQEDFADKQQHFLTLVCFDERQGNVPPIRTHIDAMPIGSVSDFHDYCPTGCTPLFDAMGESLTALHERIKDDENATGVVTVITDGLENASRKWSGEALRKLIEQLKEEGWTFSYMGSCHDVVEVTMKLSIDHVMAFDHDDLGAANSWHRDSSSKRAYYERMNRDFNANESHERKMAMHRANARAYYADRITPDWIDQLADDEVFVFGSNPEGTHTGGAAAHAVKHFGAIVGRGEGIQGKSYAIPTTGDFNLFGEAVQRFIEYAALRPHKRFLVTRVGCGNAGYSVREVARLFIRAIRLENISLPEDFWEILGLKLYKK
jgi:hypothetical protein